jgi:hypothetical protein
MRTLNFCLLLCVAILVQAENGRDFAGQYAVSHVVENNGTVTATLTVRLINYSGRDLREAQLLLQGGALRKVLAEHIGFANHTHTVVRATVVVRASEFVRWQRRGPMLTVEWVQDDGTAAHRPVELIRAATIPEGR